MRWLEEDERGDSIDTFESLLTYLKQDRKRTEKIIQQRNEDPFNKPKNKKQYNINIAVKNKDEDARRNNNCLIHPKRNHLTRKCNDFLSETVMERGQLVRELDAYKHCLSLAHIGKG